MSRFLQLHILTAYAPSNLNRDDLGRPKTAVVGGRTRLRVSSQCLKRSWRTSEVFEASLAGELGTRTKSIGKDLHKRMVDAGVDAAVAEERLRSVLETFGKLKKKGLDLETQVHFTAAEIRSLNALVDRMCTENRQASEDELVLLCRDDLAVDVAMFGRMLAASPELNVDAAVQVAHAFTVHRADVETDYFTAVDDLSADRDETGSGHIGESEFGAGVFYIYLCVDLQQLRGNLADKLDVAARGLGSLVEAAATVAPNGKQNSYASRAYASYVRAELGKRQPRSLAVAFFDGVREGDGLVQASIDALESQAARLDKVYGPTVDSVCVMNAANGTGSLDELRAFCVEGLTS